MQSNRATARRFDNVRTHGGAPAYPHITPIQALRRSVLACLLFEDQFYEGGESIADRIVAQVIDAGRTGSIPKDEVNALAIEARSEHNLRHVPLLLCAALAKAGGLKAATLTKVIQRADELSEFMAIYWRGGKTPIAKQVKTGIANAFKKFDAYQLAKYDREREVRLRDVLFLSHPKPDNEAQAALWKQLVDGTLPTPDTWETNLSGGADKRETWERMLREGKLGYLALLRNLRNMTDVGVNTGLIRSAIIARKGGAEKVLPFRYVAAARACPQMEPYLDEALCEAISQSPALPGKTIVLVDVSGSMDYALSSKSDLKRIDAAAALASVIHGDLRVFTFSQALVEVAPRRGMAGVDTIIRSQPHGGTALASAVQAVQKFPHDRLIVITDEQSTEIQRVPNPVAKHAYCINVASYRNGIGYGGGWTHLDGFSEAVLRWMAVSEAEANR